MSSISSATTHGVSPEQNLTRYLQTIRGYPMLEAKEEQNLARRWRDHDDSEAGDKLVTSHLRLVAKIAMGYRGYGLPVAELISEGNIGLMQALNRFDPERGFRFATYAMWWIRAAMQEYILHSWSLVKMGTTASQKKLFFNLRRLKGQMQAFEEGDLSPDHVSNIAMMLQVPEDDVVSMNQRLSQHDHSLNTPLNDDSDGEWQDWLESEEENQEELIGDFQELSHRRRLLNQAMTGLSQRERHILTERRLKEAPRTLEHLSQEYGISRERIRQIEVKAFEKIQKNVKSALLERRLPN
ncbi:MAG: RNA polymerase sigma factor RpoH [Rhodospirillales bacterium]